MPLPSRQRRPLLLDELKGGPSCLLLSPDSLVAIHRGQLCEAWKRPWAVQYHSSAIAAFASIVVGRFLMVYHKGKQSRCAGPPGLNSLFLGHPVAYATG
jgi:hypothetical protein